MRTTIDIPDSLFREMKAKAALQGRTLKDWILSAVRSELQGNDEPAHPGRIQLPIVNSKEESYNLSAESLAEILDEEDRELSA